MHKLRERAAARAKALMQRAVFAAERYTAHELANHAAAGAYAFLLSATPAVLLVVGIATALLRSSPAALEGVERAMQEILGPLDARGITSAFFGRPMGGIAAVIGALSLVWAARLFLVTVQRGIRVIWGERNAAIKENALAFGLEIACLVVVVAVLAAAQAARLVVADQSGLIGPLAARVVSALASLAPAAALYAFVFAVYRYVPAARPSSKVAAAAAALCIASYLLASKAFALFVNAGRYALLYGFFGSLILLLVNVYAFFCLFYYFAEIAYVEERFDALLLGRFLGLRRRGTVPARLDQALFFEPDRLLKSYGRSLAAGELVFEARSRGKEAYFVHRGSVGLYAAGGTMIGTIGPGELFGEMAIILDEPRTATARAAGPTELIEIPPEIFSEYIKTDREANRALLASLSSRLKQANERGLGDSPSRTGDGNARDSHSGAGKGEGQSPEGPPRGQSPQK